MPRLKLTLQYEGTRYAGWQVQPNGPSIQATLQAAFATLQLGDVPVTGASRTDAGVHAVGQVCHVDLAEPTPDLHRLLRGLNGVLPRDIRVTTVVPAVPEFHARYHATAKTYQYLIAPGGVVPPLIRHLVWFYPNRLDVDTMRRAAAALPGTHDFGAFQAAGSDVTDTVRTLYAATLDVVAPRGFTDATASLVAFEVCGSGFLYKMVRLLVGTLVEVGAGRLGPDIVRELLTTPDASRVRVAAPAHGLTLCSVRYADDTQASAAATGPLR